MHVSDEVYDLLAGGATAAKAGFPDAEAHALVDAYLTGMSVKVCMCGDHSAELKRMQEVDEVWLFCFRNVGNNQWRLMGRFSTVDCFVGLRAYRRGDLSGRRKYTAAGKDFIKEWDRVFCGASPIKRSHWNDYLTGPVQDVDDEL